MKLPSSKLLLALVVIAGGWISVDAQQQPSSAAGQQQPISYTLRYSGPGTDRIRLVIALQNNPPAPLTLVMPRAIPMGYGERRYDRYLDGVAAASEKGESLTVERVDGPRWRIGNVGARVSRIEYEIDLARMEREILSASDSSRMRLGYVGVLGYSVFAFVEGTENQPIRLQIDAPVGWPVFSTLAPCVTERPAPMETHHMKPSQGSPCPTSVDAPNFYALADSQVAMGPKLQVQQFKGTVPLFVAVYSEGEVDVKLEGELALDAMERVIAYFGSAPFSHYTVLLEFLKPVSRQHLYGFSMEHLDSSTYYLAEDRAITAQSTAEHRDRERFNFAHHIAHAWIPKRAFGEGYFPFTWELAPIIDTIWLSEGFIRYVSIESVMAGKAAGDARAYRQRQLDALRRIVADSPPFIRRMSLVELSRVGSTRYSEDFRTGRHLFARGALMAAEMDERIRERSAGKKTFGDAMRHLMAWSAKSRRPFRTEELPSIFTEGTGVDTRDVMEKWMKPLE